MLTIAIIIVTGIISFISFSNRRLLERLILWPPAVTRQHQYDRLVTYGLVHAVSAALFAFILVQPWATIYVYVLPVPAIIYAVLYVAYSIYMDRRRTDNVNHSAHLWGAAYGVSFTLLMNPHLFSLFIASLANPGSRFGH